jgi:hypothetical protein
VSKTAEGGSPCPVVVQYCPWGCGWCVQVVRHTLRPSSKFSGWMSRWTTCFWWRYKGRV